MSVPATQRQQLFFNDKLERAFPGCEQEAGPQAACTPAVYTLVPCTLALVPRTLVQRPCTLAQRPRMLASKVGYTLAQGRNALETLVEEMLLVLDQNMSPAVAQVARLAASSVERLPASLVETQSVVGDLSAVGR